MSKKKNSVIPGPPLDAHIRNAGFAVSDEALDPALRKQLAAALRQHALEDALEKAKLIDQHMATWRKYADPKRRKGKVSVKVQHVRDLVDAHPNVTNAGELYDLADASKLANKKGEPMRLKTFANEASRYRNSPARATRKK